jgi:hypothetical protein
LHWKNMNPSSSYCSQSCTAVENESIIKFKKIEKIRKRFIRGGDLVVRKRNSWYSYWLRSRCPTVAWALTIFSCGWFHSSNLRCCSFSSVNVCCKTLKVKQVTVTYRPSHIVCEPNLCWVSRAFSNLDKHWIPCIFRTAILRSGFSFKTFS